jgi:hypothetical protein
LHATALTVSDYLYDGPARPSIASRVLLLTVEAPPADTYAAIEPSHADDAPSDPPSTLPTPVAEAAAAPDIRAAAAPDPDVGPPEAERTEAARRDTPVDASAPVNDAQRATIEDDADQEGNASERGAVAFVASSSDSAGHVADVQTAADPAGVESAAMSPRQRQMLNRKVNQWARSADRLARMDGLQWKHQGQDYVATVKALRTADDQSIEEVIVAISTEIGGRTLSTEMRMRRLAFSNYAQFINRWDPNVGFHDDELATRRSLSRVTVDPLRDFTGR